MKNIILGSFFLLIGFKTIAQETIDVDDIKVHSFVQRKAEPKEGLQYFYKNYMRKFNSAKFSSSTGTLDVRLKFIVEKDGAFSDIQVLNESTEGLGEEAIRVLKTMPAWKPAKHNGKIVRSAYTIPINVGDKKMKENKSVNKKFDNRFIDRIVLDKTIETDEFEFKCNCSFYKESKNPKINQIAKNYELNDYEGMYSIIIQNNPEEKHIPNFDELLTSKNLVGDKKYIQLNGIKAFQIGNDSESYNKGYNVMIMFVKGDNLINIQINTENKVLTEFLVEEFIKTFKLKL